MYKYEFLQSKNQEKTVKINDFLLHSLYSPSKEAQKFIENLQPPFGFKFIFIIEPGFGYCLKYLEEKFPDTTIIIIKFDKNIPLLPDTHKIIYFTDFNSNTEFENYIYNNFNEIDLMTSFFISWHPSEKIYSSLFERFQESIKNILERSKSVLITRGYFEKKWLKNCINNFKYIKQTVKITSKTSLPIIIAASGPSLKPIIPYLKENQDIFFIIAVSSGILPLIKNNIIPDLMLSTDGGYWSGKHLETLLNKKIDTPLALPFEAFCQKEIDEKQTIIPLSYGDGISFELEKNCSFNFKHAERNGTVSGTALKLAENLTDNNIFLAGVDLHNQKGYQHTKPNKIEEQKYINSNKLTSISKNTISGEFNTGSLHTYEDWFRHQNNSNQKIYRIIDNPNNSLNKIPDISSQEFFNKYCETKNNKKISIFSSVNKITKEEKINTIKDIINYINNNCRTENWIQNLFPLDYVSYIHAVNNEEKQQILEKINNENLKFVDNLINTLQFPD